MRRSLVVILGLTFVLTALPAGRATAGTTFPDCRASVIRVESLEPVVASPDPGPCTDDAEGVPVVEIPGVGTVKALSAVTETFTKRMTAKARAGQVVIELTGAPVIKIFGAVTRGRVAPGHFALFSKVTKVKLGTEAIRVPMRETEVSLGPVGVLRFHERSQQNGETIQRAAVVDTATLDIVIAEVIIDRTG